MKVVESGYKHEVAVIASKLDEASERII